MNELVTLVSAAFLVIGSFFALVASKAGTMGSCLMLIALAIHATDVGTMSRALAGVVFFLLTAPVSSHLLAKAAYAVGYRLHASAVMDDMKPKDDA